MPDAFTEPPGVPDLDRSETDGRPRALLLMLHGGTQVSADPVGPGSGSLWRVLKLRDALAPRLLAAGYAVWVLRFAERGWNTDARGVPAPVTDARWALDRARAAYDDVPVVLLGHSMGGRTATRVADDPSVTGVLGLAPWFEPGDPVAPLAGTRFVAGHGLRDRITSARRTRGFVDRARAAGVDAQFHALGLAGHYMLYRPGRWNVFALDQSLSLLGEATGGRCGDPVEGHSTA